MNEVARTGSIGGYVPMVDGPEKVSGRAKYTADLHPSQGCWPDASIAVPMRTRRSSRSMSQKR